MISKLNNTEVSFAAMQLLAQSTLAPVWHKQQQSYTWKAMVSVSSGAT